MKLFSQFFFGNFVHVKIVSLYSSLFAYIKFVLINDQ